MLIGELERRRRIGEAGRKTVEQQYAYRVTIPELLRVLSQVMGGGKVLVASRSEIPREDP